MTTSPKEVLHFWFGPLKTPEDFPKDQATLWFAKDEAFDQQIRERFKTTLEAASQQQLHWQQTPRDKLALVILMDQFSRNIYRNKPQAFALDPLSVDLVANMILHKEDQELYPIERMFLYLPFEHSEDLKQQVISVELFKNLHEQAPKGIRSFLQEALSYAIQHYEIIERFGRFPHRNAILGRTSTQEELAFLKTPGSSF